MSDDHVPRHLAVSSATGTPLPHLSAAAARSEELLNAARTAILPHLPEDVDAVVFGSIARREASAESDFDYLVVTREQMPDAGTLSRVQDRIVQVLRDQLQLKDPGSSGLFGTWVTTVDLYMWIGLEQDTGPHALSRRALLSAGELLHPRTDAHRELLDTVVTHYLADARENEPPRFLINDVLRYWRTITVDYRRRSCTGAHGGCVT